MKTYILLSLTLALCLSACQQATPTAPSTALPPQTQPAATQTDIPTASIPTPSPEPAATQAETGLQEYIDPAGQFSLSFPGEWQKSDEEGLFQGTDGFLRVGYLPEMDFMYPVQRVCERLANTPEGPARQVEISPLANADACKLSPYPEMSFDGTRLVVENPEGTAGQRYFFIETNRNHFEAITGSLELLNPPGEREAFPYPSGEMRPQDEAFWANTGTQVEELTVEEYAVVEAAVDSPTHFEFMERIPAEVLEKRVAWRDSSPERRLAANNTSLEPFGYSLKAKEGAEMELYELWRRTERGDELVQDEISYFWPVSINAAGDDFAMVVELWNDGYRLVRQDQAEEWDMGSGLYIPPVFYGDELLSVRWDTERGQAQVTQAEQQIYAFAGVYLVDMPVKGLWSWDGHWLLEVDGFLIQDGEVLNEALGYEEIFGWQLLNGKPFYYFRKGPQVGVSYDGDTLPVYYDEVIHYRCCEASMFNNAGNEDMVWFYGLREGTWYYVEMGVYGG
jgi:PAS domain-containing protein